MSPSRSLLLVASVATFASSAQVKFLPDTVCAGNSSRCTTSETKMVLKGADTATFQVQFLLSPLDTRTELYFNAANPTAYAYFASGTSVRTAKGFRLSPQSNLSASWNRIKLKSGDTARLTGFRFGSCLICAATAAPAATPTTHLGNGERVGILFGTDTLHLDTLWAFANVWISGGVQSRPAFRSTETPTTVHDALGRRREPAATSFSLTPNGAFFVPEGSISSTP